MDVSSWKWNPRYDLDLVQRCLFILFFTWFTNWLFQLTFLNYIFGNYLVHLGSTIALLMALAKSSIQFSPKEKSVLITGCDTGFGLTLAQKLHAQGMTVFAGCVLKDQGGEGAKKLEAIAEEHDQNIIKKQLKGKSVEDRENKLHVIQLDVTSESDWQKTVTYIKENSPTHDLWGIVNNAGLSSFGEIEWVPMATYRKIMEVNMFGIIQGVQTCLPLIRKCQGRIISTTSGLARQTVPTRSPYVFSKYALAGFMDVLRYEMEAFGVKVSQIEPGNFIAGTKILTTQKIEADSKAMWDNMSEEVTKAYGEDYFKERVEIMKGYMTTGEADQSPVLDAITNGLLDVFPQKRYQAMNMYWKVRTFIATHLPEIFYDWIYISYVKRD